MGVDDVAHWLASPKRREVFAAVATSITTFILPSVAHRVIAAFGVADMAAFEAVIESEAGAAAMKHDGVRPETLVFYVAG